jgi:hypothetical protein
MTLLESAAVAGKYPYSANLLYQKSRVAACRQGSAAKSTRLFGGGFARSPMPVTDRTVTFEEEFRLFLKRYRVAFDERYVWD